MPKTTMNANQVKEARRRAAAGESVPNIAADMGLTYAPVWTAIRGITWSSICDPPPLPSLPRGSRPLGRKCQNCGHRCYYKTGGRIKGRCRPCYTYHRRHGRERPTKEPLNRQTAPPVDINRAHQLYQAGGCLAEVANHFGVSSETLRRRFLEANIKRRPKNSKMHLDKENVCQARQLVWHEGWPVARVVAELHPDVPYTTLYSAIAGYTWRSAPGPRPCATCKTITIHQSGYCWNCRPDKPD